MSEFDLSCLEDKDKVESLKIDIKLLKKENKQLKEQLKYLRSGEYLNQLKFERDMLQDLVDNNRISEDDKNFIDCTHRNTELLEENKQLENNEFGLFKQIDNQDKVIKQLEEQNQKAIDYIAKDMQTTLFSQLPKYQEILDILQGKEDKYE